MTGSRSEEDKPYVNALQQPDGTLKLILSALKMKRRYADGNINSLEFHWKSSFKTGNTQHYLTLLSNHTLTASVCQEILRLMQEKIPDFVEYSVK